MSMYFKGFKIAVTANFVVLVLVGMLLVNIVVTFFWRQHIVHATVDHARSSLSFVSSGMHFFCDTDVEGKEFSTVFLKSFGQDSAISAAVLENGSIRASQGRHGADVEAVLRRAVQLDAETSQAVGGFWSLFGVSARDIVMARPVDNCNGLQAVGMIVHMPDIVAELHGSQYAVWVYLLVNALILTILWFFRMRRLVIAPLENLVDMSESFGIAEVDYIGPVSQKNEFGQLADALGNMLARIERDKAKLSETVASLEEANAQLLANQQVLVEAEKFAAVGRLSAGLAHEIGNPLGIIQGYIELLGRDDIDEAERRQYGERAEKELARVTRLIRQLLDLARKKSDQQSSTSVAPVVDEVVDMLRQQKNTRDIQFSVDCADGQEHVRCSEADLHQVLLNCLLNALDAIHEQDGQEGKIDISCRCRDEDAERVMDIIIQDNGTGIQADGLKNVFDPFFTTKAVGRGTGLGLSVCRSIVETCGGVIRLESEEAVYTRVVTTLPVA